MWISRPVSILLVVAAAALIGGCGGDDDDDDDTAAATGAETTAGGGSGATTVGMTEFEFDPDDLTVSQGDTITAQNDGNVEHNLTIREGPDPEQESAELAATPDVQSGDSADLIVDVDSGKHSMVCTLPGHAEQGMIGTITVE
jgi:plastocyanin